MNTNLIPDGIPKLDDLPLWRLIVMLDDAERLVGPQSDSARIVATTIRQRMRCGRIAPDLTKEVRDA